MHWLGIVALLVGAILAFVVRGDLTPAGYLVMGAGAVLLAVGVWRLGRARRRTRAAGGPDTGYRTGTGKIAAMIAAAVYIVSPLDLVPDVFLPVGVVDDATAFGWLVFALGQEMARRSRGRRLSRGSSPRPGSSPPPRPR
ncbi:Protein of unknown function [Thermomonospora echinospora]|uniref:DUF1232 domain-containing protein n=1 Tax=Thermomonospora echinospora TaxID=1992 RepID=A0A1H5TCW7_9ACTN|nr:DUF1232 domain-containing protein [Thermomonospora echinospora]SEF60639.1 Protein of unknown function [Thermomonospora echinospora]